MSTIHLPLPETARRDRDCAPSAAPAGRSDLASPITLQHYAHGRMHSRDDMVAVEDDLRVRIDGRDELLLARTPGDDEDLVTGHLFSRSLIHAPEDIRSMTFRGPDNGMADVCLRAPRVRPGLRPQRPLQPIRPEQFFEYRRVFEARQQLYRNTGSTHAAALISAEGELLTYGEDVGRHNAFDKAVGRALIQGTLERAAIALLSSRLALELAVKAATANIPILCGFSAATSAGIGFARERNITLVGRIREDSFIVYANGWRIKKQGPESRPGRPQGLTTATSSDKVLK
jgi:FdhD protein